ncbi:hypothetical protein [Sphingomonas morindae]|uniref:Sensor histidine kinase n=1 Tax=Sphingomonas morindae TaxID=1541170 RepID=A0ABY4X403_9SPHN|nr:hypothetical protein [Sphingomonas morindae]USI71606.1 hypothetical protein LHA26_09680 [Sphingomonas morindae]
MSAIAAVLQQWPSIAAALGAAGGGGLIVKLLEHGRAKRKQTDEVALDLVKRLTARIETLEQAQAHEREVCEARLSSVRHELRNVAANFDGLLLALKYASPERIQEIVADVLARRAAAIQPIPNLASAAARQEVAEIALPG